ncbi:class I adenylate-forming enzyme family protein [Capillimicrobium parvum]|uniref:class I adenylate-forming enzyme family protein n=1 Tax=Capillimicrobium parvum TaxID=2884022 RepID=UPI00216AE172|nr:AMP-binding protein [Capillimicrobium parvum]
MPAEIVPSYRNALELYERSGGRDGADAALHYFDATISVAAARECAVALAAALRDDYGIAAGDRVALMMQNIPQFAMTLHAIWLAGAVPVCINVMAKRGELLHYFGDSEARAVVCLESLYAVVGDVVGETPIEQVITVCELDFLESVPAMLATHRRLECPGAVTFASLVERHRGTRLEPADPEPDALALLAYTSGTTGPPKAAEITHAALVQTAETYRVWWQLGPGDVTVAMAPLFHITGIAGHLCASRAAGIPMVLFYRFEAAEMLRLIERWRGTWIIGPTTAFLAMMSEATFATRDISSLVKVATGGAPVHPGVVERYEKATGVYIHNTYGMTESSGPTHMTPLGRRAPVDPVSGALAVGVPVCGTDAKIADPEDGSELPAGEVGEILMRGSQVVRRYWRDAAASRQTVRDGWLHSGDLGRRDDDGWFFVIDRLKDIINASGFKVWPREVEDVLHRHPGVAEACVVGAPDDYRGETVLAYVTLREPGAATPAELIAFSREQLAVYKCPSEVHVVNVIPKTASGKVLRRELRARGRAPHADPSDRK